MTSCAYNTTSDLGYPFCTAQLLNGIKHSIIIPTASAAPSFHGKHNESSTQFLIRVQEYAESVHSWDRNTLVIGNFEIMSSCQKSLIRRKEAEDDCIYQILTDTLLKDYRTESLPNKVFIKQIGQFLVISTGNSSDYDK